jgi:hypothetical protein
MKKQKKKRNKRPPTVEGMDVDEFIRRNADPIWLHQNEMWEVLHEREMADGIEAHEASDATMPDDISF